MLDFNKAASQLSATPEPRPSAPAQQPAASRQAQIIPFGKYRGQPVEVLRADPGYVDWVMSQDWFRDRYQPIYQIIINNFGAPTETPEHNKLQAKLLKDDFCLGLLTLWKDEVLEKIREATKRVITYLKDEAQRLTAQVRSLEKDVRDGEEYRYRDVDGSSYYKHQLQGLLNDEARLVEKRQELMDCYAALKKLDNYDPPTEMQTAVDRSFELAGWDVWLDFESRNKRNRNIAVQMRLWIEIKPCLGDDYPSILRQMRANVPPAQRYADGKTTKAILLYDRFTASGATLEQVTVIFKTAGFKVVSFDEVAVSTP